MKIFLCGDTGRLNRGCEAIVRGTADVTLGDFWGVEKIKPELSDNKGVSLMLLHSPKGERVLEEIMDNLICESVDYSEAIAGNGSYLLSSPQTPLRENFYKKVDSRNFDKTVNRLCGNGYTSKARRLMKKFF